MAESVRTGDEESPLKEYLDQAEREVDLKRSNEDIARENSRLKLQLEVLYSEMRAARAQASLDRVLREQETVVQTPTSTPVPPDPGDAAPGGRETPPDPGSAEKPADTSGNLSAAEEQLVDRWTQVFVQRMSPAVTRGNRRCQACGGNMADFPPVTRGNMADFPPVTRGNRRCQACRALEENLSDSVLAAAPERGAGRRVSAAEDHLLDRWADRLAERLLSFSQPQRRLAECLADTSLPVVPCGEAEQASPYTPGGASSRDHDTESPCQMCWEAANDSLAAVQARIRRDSSTAPSESEPALQRTGKQDEQYSPQPRRSPICANWLIPQFQDEECETFYRERDTRNASKQQHLYIHSGLDIRTAAPGGFRLRCSHRAWGGQRGCAGVLWVVCVNGGGGDWRADRQLGYNLHNFSVHQQVAGGRWILRAVQPQRADRPAGLYRVPAGAVTPGGSRGRCSHSARTGRPGCTGCLRVVGELAFQLDMQILHGDAWRIPRAVQPQRSERPAGLYRVPAGAVTPGGSRGRCSHSARTGRPGCAGCLRVVGELAFQLDMQILQYVFQRRRLYGFTLRNIADKIREEADKEKTAMEARVRTTVLETRLRHVLGLVEPAGYDWAVHPRLAEELVNQCGVVKGRLDNRTLESLGYTDPCQLHHMVSSILPPSRVRGVIVLLDSLRALTANQGKPLFSF
ncbi:Speriolin C-terminus [Branchiostoma belcheri]|nr:Speriolin C-terminus [Branchiostoma belcheri]